MSDYVVVETKERVPVTLAHQEEMVTRWRWRAERACRAANARREVAFTQTPYAGYAYRFEVVGENGRFTVVAFQNRLELT
jgi:hypothetical protein